VSTERLILSEKYKAFLRCNAPVEFLEGTTAAGKTTVGLFKFMCKVAESPKKLHILAAKDTGTAEKNIINKDLGIVDDFGILTEYNGNGTKDDKIPHILFHTNKGDKVIYVMGYGDKKKWQKALGGQYGCLYIDEINTADIDFVREASMRCDYLMATLNPDDPTLDVYKEYINSSRPLPEWEQYTPQEIKDEFKDSEGDPQVKGQIRRKMQEISRRRMMQQLPEADVVITNPTHFAVALKYEPDSGMAPVVIAKGADYLAFQIREKAKECNIEIVENKCATGKLIAVQIKSFNKVSISAFYR